MRFVTVSQEEEPCPYLPGQMSLLPLRLPSKRVEGERLDACLEAGDRRAGPFLYRTNCRSCAACEPIRLPTDRLELSRSQQKVWRKNEGQIEITVGEPSLTVRHLELFNRHKLERGLGQDITDATGYARQFLASCTDGLEVRYLVGGRLVAVSLLDMGKRAASSVYHYFDPDEARRSLGVYSILREVQISRELGLDWYYLGLYVADCASLSYKADYFPHQRKIDGRWIDFSRELGEFRKPGASS